jgi:DNA-binding beta-propeller fold protein YncE
LFSLVLTPKGSAEEPGLLYGTAVGGTELVAFNLQAESVRVIGATGFPGSLSLAFCRPGGRPYTITNMGNASLAQLATLDLSTGAATLVGSPLGQPLSIMGMTCSPDGSLYAVGQGNVLNPDFNSLYTVDRETGLASLIGATGVAGFFMALDFAPDGTLYGANTSSLYTIDTLTGQATKVVDFAGVTMVMGLAIGQDWNFYVSDYVAQSSIWAVDVVTGAATPILATGLAKVHNIAFKFPGR